MKYIIDHIWGIIAAIPLILVTFGIFVINQYLSPYNVVDFPLFEPKTIYIGFFSLFLLFAFILNWYVFLSIEEKKYGLLLICINTIIKPLFFCQFLWSIIVGSDYIEKITIFYKTIDIKIIFLFMLLLIISHYSYQTTFRLDIIKGKPYSKTFQTSRVLDIILIILCFIISVLIMFNSKIYRDIYISYLYISIMLFFQTLFYRDRIFNKDDVIKNKPVSYFSKTTKLGKLDKCFIILWMGIMLMVYMNNYANNVFPYIPTDFGGAKYKYNVIVLDDDEYLNGKIIFQSNDYIYLINNEQELLQIKREKIKIFKKQN